MSPAQPWISMPCASAGSSSPGVKLAAGPALELYAACFFRRNSIRRRFVISGCSRAVPWQTTCAAIGSSSLAMPVCFPRRVVAWRSSWPSQPPPPAWPLEIVGQLLRPPHYCLASRLLEITDCFTGGHEPGRDDTFSGCRLPAGVVLYKVLWKMVMRTTSRFCLSSKASLVIIPLRCEVIPMLGN